MPPYPKSASSVAAIQGAVYSALADRIASWRGELFPLHVGDTWLEPALGCRMQDLTVEEHPGMHRYAPPQGLPRLIDAIVERARRRSGVATERDNVLVTAGATGALGAAMGAILEPGDEVLVLAPHWPLITGIVRCYHGRPVVVPFLGEVDSAETAVAQVRAHHTARTAALYLSTPNNPTGVVLPRPWIEALVAWAAAAGLWIVTDEVYEDYVYRGEHTYARALDPQRTLSAHSFSKAFGMAGNRCGYVVGPASILRELCKVSTHAFYATPTASQIAACRALEGAGDAWIAEIRGQYAALGDHAAQVLGLPPPAGSTFLFLDVSAATGGGGLGGFLEDCASRGLFLAPGPSFGPYPGHVRICFTAAAPATVRRGVAILGEMLGRNP